MSSGLDENDVLTIADGRGNSFCVSPKAFVSNLESLRRRLNPGTEVWQVVKGNGYGMGIEVATRLGRAAGVDGYCVGSGAEARRLRELEPNAPVLVFTACPPEQLSSIAALDVIVTVNSIESFDALASHLTAAKFMLELDCGFGRYGLDADGVRQLRDRRVANPNLKCVGAYTHFGMAADNLISEGTQKFDSMLSDLSMGVETPLVTMVASSETALRAPQLPYSAVDPGRLLYGLAGLDAPAWGIRPVVLRATSALAQVNRHSTSQRLTIGYGEPRLIQAGTTTGVFPLGWYDGLSTAAPFGVVVVAGVRCEVLARTLMHSVVDLSAVPEVCIGDEVVIFDNEGVLPLDLAAVAQNQSALWLHIRLLNSISSAGEADCFEPALGRREERRGDGSFLD